MQNNAYFHTYDPRDTRMDDYDMPPVLWIHPWMYAFALQFAKPGMVVGDFGTGWHYRPFRYELARRVGHVYAVDSNSEVTLQKLAQNLEFIVADFTDAIPCIESESLDLIYFIHCLERETVSTALWNAAKLLKPDGRIVICADSPYDPDKPLRQWKGLNINALQCDAAFAGLYFDGPVDLNKDNLVIHEEWNLCNFHCVLRKGAASV